MEEIRSFDLCRAETFFASVRRLPRRCSPPARNNGQRHSRESAITPPVDEQCGCRIADRTPDKSPGDIGAGRGKRESTHARARCPVFHNDHISGTRRVPGLPVVGVEPEPGVAPRHGFEPQFTPQERCRAAQVRRGGALTSVRRKGFGCII